jgi:hypothetical protein
MGMLNGLTGGHNEDAANAASDAYSAFARVGIPTTTQLTLPELQKYVQAGVITPAQAQAVLQKQNAMDSVTSDPRTKEAEISALNKMQALAENGGHDAQSDMGVADAQSKMNQTLQGQRASVLDQMAARGIPTSLMGTAAQLAFAGQDSEQAHKDALQAKADAEQRALQAISGTGQLAGQINNQDFNQQAVKAQSQNAIDQWNAANQTNVNLANQQATQQANVINNQVAQQVSSANTQNANARTQYNATIPQTQFQDQIQRAAGESQAKQAEAKLQQAQGEQNAGMVTSILGVGGTVLGGMYGGPAGAAAGGAAGHAAGTAMGSKDTSTNEAAFAHGGIVPGQPNVPGNSPANDTVKARLSPGEVVIPRTAAQSPNLAAEFVRHLHKAATPKVHPDDVKHVLHALTAMRGGF